ncbi:LLM class flavin-dependent oxidoreductase [Rhodococcus zopfii]|uniref:LLM class flavin-dependent oxidoreductase n=1 Tax=Rhodococcus zopfii TaxID=43772 RepID=UPI0036465779
MPALSRKATRTHENGSVPTEFRLLWRGRCSVRACARSRRRWLGRSFRLGPPAGRRADGRPWIALTAMAIATSSIRLGALVTPVPRRHVAKLAREVSTLDQLSSGRVVFGAGAGYAALPDYSAFGDTGTPAERAAALDEALAVLDQLWSGSPVEHDGPHCRVSTTGFTPTVQRPRVPIWTAATKSAVKPLTRAARWDGMICADTYGLEIEPADLKVMVEKVRAVRDSDAPLDVIRFGRTDNPEDVAVVEACAEAGATWWMEYTFPQITDIEGTRKRVRKRPPRIG